MRKLCTDEFRRKRERERERDGFKFLLISAEPRSYCLFAVEVTMLSVFVMYNCPSAPVSPRRSCQH